jgi:hypothetical protein
MSSSASPASMQINQILIEAHQNMQKLGVVHKESAKKIYKANASDLVSVCLTFLPHSVLSLRVPDLPLTNFMQLLEKQQRCSAGICRGQWLLQWGACIASVFFVSRSGEKEERFLATSELRESIAVNLGQM